MLSMIVFSWLSNTFLPLSVRKILITLLSFEPSPHYQSDKIKHRLMVCVFYFQLQSMGLSRESYNTHLIF